MSDCGTYPTERHTMIMTTVGIQCRKCGWVSVRAKKRTDQKS